MDVSQAAPHMEAHLGMDIATEEDYASQSRLLKEFTDICNIDKAWIFKSENGISAYLICYLHAYSSLDRHFDESGDCM